MEKEHRVVISLVDEEREVNEEDSSSSDVPLKRRKTIQQSEEDSSSPDVALRRSKF